MNNRYLLGIYIIFEISFIYLWINSQIIHTECFPNIVKGVQYGVNIIYIFLLILMAVSISNPILKYASFIKLLLLLLLFFSKKFSLITTIYLQNLIIFSFLLPYLFKSVYTFIANVLDKRKINSLKNNLIPKLKKEILILYGLTFIFILLFDITNKWWSDFVVLLLIIVFFLLHIYISKILVKTEYLVFNLLKVSFFSLWIFSDKIQKCNSSDENLFFILSSLFLISTPIFYPEITIVYHWKKQKTNY